MVDPDPSRSARACQQLAQVACHFPLSAGSPPLTPLLSSARKSAVRGSKRTK